MNVPRRVALFAPAALLLAPRRARADATLDVLRDVSAARSKVRTLRAPFTQERVLSLLATSVTSTGEMTTVRPDRLRWELRPPDEAIYWVTPEGIAYKTPNGSGRVAPGAAGPLAAVLGDLLVVLGGDLASLRSRNDVTAERRSDGGARLVLAPKDPKVAKLVRRVTAEIAPDLVSPQKILLEESGDDRTTVTFGDATVDGPVDPAKMKPPG